MQNVVRLALALALGICGAAFAATQTSSPAFRFLGKRGPHAVGLNVVDQYDASRRFLASAGSRPLQTLVWYPAVETNGKAMTVGDYAQLAGTEIHFDRADEGNRWIGKLATSATNPLWAVRDASPSSGRFPVVIYAPGQSSVAWDNADLCEYLASQGYVVLAVPSLGASTRDADDNLDDLRAEARDISFLVDYARTLTNADVSQVAVVGWSWGGLANVFAAAHDDRIKALVALDGSLRYYPGLLKKTTDIHPERMSIPLLFFTRGDVSLEDWSRYATADNEGPSALNAWTRGDLVTVHMLGMSHPEFSSMTQRAHDDRKFAENRMADYDRDDVNVSYAWVARYTLAFLDTKLRKDPNGTAFLTSEPASHGVPRHILTVDVRAADAAR